jgi:hypothetical protein
MTKSACYHSMEFKKEKVKLTVLSSRYMVLDKKSIPIVAWKCERTKRMRQNILTIMMVD